MIQKVVFSRGVKNNGQSRLRLSLVKKAAFKTKQGEKTLQINCTDLFGAIESINYRRGLQKVHGIVYYGKTTHDFRIFCAKINLSFNSIFPQMFKVP